MAKRATLAAVPRLDVTIAVRARTSSAFHEERLESSPLYRRRETEYAATKREAQEWADCYVNHRRPSTIY